MAGHKDNKQDDLKSALHLARTGDWDHAHRIIQELNEDPMSCWLHAVLHKIEGDETNARYWYARCNHDFQDFADPELELTAIANATDGQEMNG